MKFVFKRLSVCVAVVLLTFIVLGCGSNDTRERDIPLRISGNIPVEMLDNLTLFFEFDLSLCRESDNIFRINDVNANMIKADFSVIGDVSGVIPDDYVKEFSPHLFYPFSDDGTQTAIIHTEDGVIIYLRHFVRYLENFYDRGVNVDNSDGHMNHIRYALVSFTRDETGGVLVETARWHPIWVDAVVTSSISFTK